MNKKLYEEFEIKFPTEKEVGLEQKVILKKEDNIEKNNYLLFLGHNIGFRRIGFVFGDNYYKEKFSKINRLNDADIKKY